MIELLFATDFLQTNGERDSCGEYLLYNDLSFDICKKRNPISNWNRTNVLKVCVLMIRDETTMNEREI